MPGDCLILEEYWRLLNAAAARFVPGFACKPNSADDDQYDAMRLLPVSSLEPCVDRLLGLQSDVPIEWRVAEYLGEHASDLMTVRALNSMRIGDALEVAHKNHRVQTNARTITHRYRNDGRLVAIHQADKAHDPVIRFLFQTITATKLYLLFKFYGGSEKQHEINLKASSFGALMRRFDQDLDFIDIQFREGEIGYDFSRDALAYKLADPNDRLIRILDRELARRAAEVPTCDAWKERIEYHIRSNHLSTVSLEDICDTFRVQKRTLGRLLREEGTTFSAILSELRREKALHLVRQTDVPLKRVAAELGFNSDASFSMAFKSWTGETPMRFRKAALDRTPANDAEVCPIAKQVTLSAERLQPTHAARPTPISQPLLATYRPCGRQLQA